jgi:hypothetical protein
MERSFVEILEFVEQNGYDTSLVETGALRVEPSSFSSAENTLNPSSTPDGVGVSSFPIVNEELSGCHIV